MARTSAQQPREISLAARRVPATISADGSITCRADRMARFAAGARRVIVRAAAAGALVAAGWLLAVAFGMLSAAPAAADSTAATGAGTPQAAIGSSPVSGTVPASSDAGAMAGLTVDGLTSQSDPGLPPPSTADNILDTDGLVPNGGGNGPFGPNVGDVARSVFDPRLEVRHAPMAFELPPVVRTAADDPSFSPD
ncbi:hypothetical protein [Nonomuraea sp. LPB2021202275-12-8]|uniref:hypothetical protein n=1 Tax=Nonomuraea sp. LPB2021202275-12-8 TaxID=3120159 RepID=UPI00300D726C